MSARNAAGVRIAMAMAAFVVFFRSSGSTSAETVSVAAILLRLKRYAAVTVAIPMTQKTGRPCVRISDVEIPAAPAETAGAPWMTKS